MKKLPAAVAIGLALWAASIPVSAAESGDTYAFIFENDLFYHTDRDYTNGIELSWSPSETASGVLPAFISSLIPQPFAQGDNRASYSLGQLMFTPEDTASTDPPTSERPYAGYLYGAYALTNTIESRQDVLRIQLGMVGPASLAQDSQTFIHRLRGFALPQGWHTQLRDEPGLVISYQRTQNMVSATPGEPSNYDIKAHFGGAIGNVFDYIDAGTVARLGFNMPNDSGPPQIGPALPGSYIYEPQKGLGAYLFVGIEGRAVGRNIFLDGNSFEYSRSVAKNPLVGDFSVGGAVTFDNYRLSFIHMFRSQEYRAQKGFDEFGTLCLSFNV